MHSATCYPLLLLDRSLLGLEDRSASIMVNSSQPLSVDLPERKWMQLVKIVDFTPIMTAREPQSHRTHWIGAQPLGYSGSFANISRLASLVRYGPTPQCNADNFATTYFRLPFPVTRPETIVGLSANLWRNQGTAVHLNGVEIFRDDNLPTGSSFDDFTTAPLDGPETVPITIDPTLLLEGRNLLAVETHLAFHEDSELVFALSLTSRDLE